MSSALLAVSRKTARTMAGFQVGGRAAEYPAVGTKGLSWLTCALAQISAQMSARKAQLRFPAPNVSTRRLKVEVRMASS